jgi:hypothetical protein
MNIIAFLLFAVIRLATKGTSPLQQAAADEHADIYSIYFHNDDESDHQPRSKH